jgi:hypothetical protein
MSTIDPKWIQIDDATLEVVENIEGDNELAIKTGVVLEGVSVERVNGTKFTVSNTMPTGTVEQPDVWIETP